MVLKYTWTDADGRDFDTATHVEGTEISDLDNEYVGFGFAYYIPYIAARQVIICNTAEIIGIQC